MKKIFTLVICLTVMAITIKAQSINSFFDTYSEDNRFTYVSIGKGMMKMMEDYTDLSGLEENVMSKINGMRILTLDDEWEMKLAKSVLFDLEKALKTEKFEKMMEVRDTDEQVRIYTKTNSNDSGGILIITQEEDELNIIWMSGDLSLNEMMKMSEDYVI